ncbi:alpha-glucosidase [Ferruginibacter yonginensis]|uniref:Alpha-glucosidase n=1 Tax=Ferruginibacter yonginensis TaxID=1310416 RepID=A0ABV8QRD5_9BACT
MCKLLRLSFFLCLLLQLLACQNQSNKTTAAEPNSINNSKKWWKEAVVYQVYPRSFKDSDGDGIGDLKGLTSQLDYIKSLGVDIVWLNPIYSSPNADNGYDISNYDDIMKEFGTMQDFDTLLAAMHQRGIKLVLDLVVNHCSDEHEWFKQARSSRTNKYRNYFHWWPAEKGKPPFRPGSFEVDGSGWRFDSLTNSYYLHYFSYKQPDLNWENPALRKEIYAMMNRWLKKGIDGFRMDVIPVIAKDTTFPVITQAFLDKNFNGDWFQYFASTPSVHTYLQEMNKEVLSKYDAMSLAEGAGTTKATAMNFVDPSRHELDMSYHFDGVSLGYVPGYFKKMNPNWDLPSFKKIYSEWDSVFAKKGWGTIYLGNHDQPRMVTRWGNDAPEYREVSSKMLTTFLLSMRGTPYYYYGDELGMTNIKFDKIEDYKDIETIAAYEQVKNKGGDLKQFIEDQKTGGARDNGRTPMQWNAGTNAGFTTGLPWIKVNDNKNTINVEFAEKNPSSTLHYFRKMIQLRKAHKDVLVYGDYNLLDASNPSVYAYTRASSTEKVLVLLSFKPTGGVFDLGNLQLADEWINNATPLKVVGNKVVLQPYQACIVKLK